MGPESAQGKLADGAVLSGPVTMSNLYETQGQVSRSPWRCSELVPHLSGTAGPSGFSSRTTAEQVAAKWDGAGKVAIVTGCNTGLGKETARVLATRGAEVIMAVRDTARGEEAAAAIRAQHPSAQLTVMACDLSSLKSVQLFAADFKQTGKPCCILLANAGVMMCPYTLTADGHEMQFGTNHLGHFALITALLPVLKATGQKAGEPARVVVLSSSAHYIPYKPKQGGPVRFASIDSPEGYSPGGAYGQSKLCNLLFARELDKRLEAEGAPVVAVACHPGVIMTELMRHVGNKRPAVKRAIEATVRFTLRWALKTIPEGAATSVYLCSAKGIKGGEYYVDCNIAPSSVAAHDAALGAMLWEYSEQLVAAAVPGLMQQ